MPALGDIDQTYPLLLETENHIRLLEPFTGSKKHHSMQCMECGHVWTATPLSKRQTYKKYGVGGCPNCNNKKKQSAYQNARDVVLSKLQASGIEVLSDYDGSQFTTQLVKFKNIHCGHEFETYPGNVIQLNTTCTVCGKKDRASTITTWSKANSAKCIS